MNTREIWMVADERERLEAFIDRYLELDEMTGNRTLAEKDEMLEIGDAIMPTLINERRRLLALIGTPPEGSHPDEWKPRDSTWHKERKNWAAEVERLRMHAEELEGRIANALA